MKEKLVIFTLLLFLFVPKTLAQVGVGITTYRITLRGSVGDVYTPTIGIMNPSDYTTKVKVVFECSNCISEVKLFGVKLFEDIEIPSEYFTLDKEVVDVPPHTMSNSPIKITIKFAPKLLVKKNLKFYTPDWINFFIKGLNPHYDGSFTIPYYTLLVGKKELEGKLSANVIKYEGGPLGVMPSVAATLTMTAYGMPLGSLILIIIAIIIIVFLILKRIFKFKITKIFKIKLRRR